MHIMLFKITLSPIIIWVADIYGIWIVSMVDELFELFTVDLFKLYAEIDDYLLIVSL